MMGQTMKRKATSPRSCQRGTQRLRDRDSLQKDRKSQKQPPAPSNGARDVVECRVVPGEEHGRRRHRGAQEADPTPEDLEEVLDSLGIGQIEDLEQMEAEEPLTEAQLEAFQVMFEQFAPHFQGNITAVGLRPLLDSIGMNVSTQQLEATLLRADYDGDGQVGFQDFLVIMTDSQKFSSCLKADFPDPHQSLEDTGSLFHTALSQMLKAGLIPRTATEEIVRYYHKKSLRHVLGAARQEDKHSHVIAYYAKAAHLIGLQSKQLMKCIQPQAQSNSPYSTRPRLSVTPDLSFAKWGPKRHPLLCRLARLPSSKTQKTLEIEECIRQFSMKLEGMETKEMITPVRIKVKLRVADRGKLTYDDIGQIRCKAEEGLHSYLHTLSGYKERDAWNLWCSLQKNFGPQGRRDFLETFSTYSWSWSGGRRMVQVKDLEQRCLRHILPTKQLAH